jgi:hypothetical protein
MKRREGEEERILGAKEAKAQREEGKMRGLTQEMDG